MKSPPVKPIDFRGKKATCSLPPLRLSSWKNSRNKNKSLIFRNLKSPKFQRIQYIYLSIYIYVYLNIYVSIYIYVYVSIHIYMCIYIYIHIGLSTPSDHHRLVPASTTRASALEETDFHTPWTYRASNAPYELSLENPALVVWPETTGENTYLLIFLWQKNQRVLILETHFNVQKTPTTGNLKIHKGLGGFSCPLACCSLYLKVETMSLRWT